MFLAELVSLFGNTLTGDVGFMCALVGDEDDESILEECDTIAIGSSGEDGEDALDCTQACCLDAFSFNERAHACSQFTHNGRLSF